VTASPSAAHALPATRGQIFSWALFDFANTGFYVIIITLVFPIYFKNIIAGGNEAYWGRTISFSMLLTALIGPVLGSVADATNRKKLFLALFSGACIVATALMYWTSGETFWVAVALLIVANVGFEGGTVFYDAFLPEITTEKNYGRVSGYGFAMGYLGSFAILLIVLPILTNPAATVADTRLTFLIAAAFFAFFSLPMFYAVREYRAVGSFPKNIIQLGYRRLRDTFRHVQEFSSVRKFLLAYFVYNDSILTIIAFSGIFAEKTLGLSIGDLVYFFLIVQGTAFFGSILFGLITNRVGPRTSILITLALWIGIVGGEFFVQTKEMFFLLGAVAGVALGSSQSTSRTMMALLTPKEKKAEFFGFYDGFFGKASAVVGPLIFGELSSQFGERPAVLSIGLLFVLGFVLLLRVPEPTYSKG
jgi:UMF1 family MFS transporter